MQKLIVACLLLVILAALQTKAFAATAINCKFKDDKIENIKTIQLTDEALMINGEMEIPLEKSRIKCGNFGRQNRLDGLALGYQVVLKSCSNDAQLEGHLIDSVKEIAAEVMCDQSIQE
jgi:hypothetical protein